MNRTQFIEELSKKLKRLPQEEIDNALSFYEEYFDEAGIDSQQDVLKELETPSIIASQLLTEYAFKEEVVEVSVPKKGISSVWFIVLAIFAAPIALPLAFALVMVILAMAIVVVSLIFAFSMVTLAFFIAGISIAFAGASVMTQGFWTSIMFMGLGFIFIGLSLLFGTLTALVSPIIFKGIATLGKKSLSLVNRTNK
ncbi:MAG: DUF1700 domain-containing protein [Turicibacter sp.]